MGGGGAPGIPDPTASGFPLNDSVAKHVLLVTDRAFLRPADGSARTYLMWLRVLQSLGCRISLLSFNRRSEKWTANDIASLRAEGCDVLVLDATSSAMGAIALQLLGIMWRTLTGQRYLPGWVEDAVRPAQRRSIAAFLRQRPLDAVVVNKLRTTHLMGRALLAQLPARKLVDIHDNFPLRVVLTRRVILRKLLRRRDRKQILLREVLDVLTWASQKRMLSEEIELLSCYDHAVFNAQEEAATFVNAGLPPAKACVLPLPRNTDDLSQPEDAPRPYQLGFIASAALFNAEAAQFLADCILPLLSRRPVRLLVVGSVCRVVREMMPADCTTFVEWIADVRDFYRQVEVVVVPLLTGTGVSTKAMEAAAHGAAIVATRVGCRGVDLEPGRDLLVADTAAGFAAAIDQVLTDATLRERLRENSARSLRMNHSEEVFAERVRILL
jgi:glycosyltransferase involved in cell wall biosynthesis